MKPKTVDFEQSELLLYQNMLYKDAGLYEQSIKHMEENQKYILDKLKLEENRGKTKKSPKFIIIKPMKSFLFLTR